MSTTVCPYCGQVHRSGAKFCPATGKLIEAETGAQQAVGSGERSSAGPVPMFPQASPAAAYGQGQDTSATAGATGKLPASHILHDRFVILRKIGHGGMAAVYQVIDTWQPGTLWAVKEMSDAALGDPAEHEYAVHSFFQEANLLRTLSHPNLPRVIDVFTEGGKHYLVMEYVPGKTLFEMLQQQRRPFTEVEVLPWALQLCDVLDYLHNQNPKIIFRDLKPSNIMITTQGQVKLIDFGIARFFKPGKSVDTMALGTPGFAAPEALGGQTDERSDLYSLNVTLHYLLTLCDPVQSMFKLPAVRSLNPAVTPEMETIVMYGVRNERDRRWQNAAQMRAELARVATGLWGIPDQRLSSPGTPRVEVVAAPGMQAGAAAYMATRAAAGQPAYPATKPGNISPTVSSAPPALPGAPQTAGVNPWAEARPPRQSIVSRPTTRLLVAAADLKAWQLVVLCAVVLTGLVAAAWLLTPLLEKIKFDWNQVPMLAVFSAFAYAAYPRRGVVFMSQVVFSLVVVGTIWLRLDRMVYTWGALLLGAFGSAAVMEGWMLLLPRKVRAQSYPGSSNEGSWWIEVIWLAIMAVLGTVIFLGLVTGWKTGYYPLQIILSALLGAIGWFIGDLLRQYLRYRQTGLQHLR
jgi:serine/threonine protein kinase